MNKKIRLSDWIMGILFTFGILLAGSDGDCFPWVNFAGTGLLGLMLVLEKYVMSAEHEKSTTSMGFYSDTPDVAGRVRQGVDPTFPI